MSIVHVRRDRLFATLVIVLVFVVVSCSASDVVEFFNGFQRPVGVAVDHYGRIFVADRSLRQIRKFDGDGKLILSIAVTPKALTVDSTGNLYVLTDANIVNKYSLSGQLIEEYRAESSANGVGVDSEENVYISEGNSVHKYSPNGTRLLVMTWTNSEALGLAVDATGTLYVCYANVIARFSSNGTWLPVITDSRARFVAVDADGNIFGSEISTTFPVNNARIVKWAPNGTRLVDFKDTNPPLGSPGGITLDRHGRIYFTDTLNLLIYTFTCDFVQLGFNLPSVQSPVDVTYDVTHQHLYITDKWGIIKMRPDGTQLALFTNIRNPTGVAVDSAGHIYASEGPNIWIMSSDGVVLASFTTVNPSLYSASALTLDDSGNLYCADAGNNRIVKFAPNGAHIYDYTTVNPSLNGPTGIVLNQDELYVADTKNGRIVVFLGDMIRVFTSIGFLVSLTPSSLAFDYKSQQQYVTDTFNQRIVVFNNQQVQIDVINTTTLMGAPRLFGIAVDEINNIYVSDNGNSRIVKFSRSMHSSAAV